MSPILKFFIVQIFVLYRKHTRYIITMSNERGQHGSGFSIQRKWQKVIDPIVKYGRKNNGFDDQLGFYYELEKIIELGYRININIPQTLTGAHDNFLQTVFSSQNEQIGQVKLTPTFSKTKFQLQAEKSIQESLRKIKNNKTIQFLFSQQEDNINNRTFSLPYVVMKQKKRNDKNYQKQNFIMVWNSYEYKKISGIDVNQISQVYIFSKNLTASIVRFFYFANNIHSVAYKIQNEQGFIGKKKSKDLWKVEQKNELSCFFMKIMHQDKSFYQQTLNLIKSIEKSMNKEVNKIVTDWILDPSNRYYLIDVKQVVFVEPKPKFRIHKSLTQLLSTVTCSMCLQTCNQSQITKVLTNKLINNFYKHLNKRGCHLSFRINFKKISNLSRVCDLCYSVVVAQTKLIQAQRKMSKICNFKMQEQNIKQNCFQQENIHKITMNQWRLFFYLEDIKDLFKIFNQKTNKQNLPVFYLTLEIDDSITYFQLKSPFTNNFSIKGLKIQYIFSESLDIRAFIKQSQVKFKILSKPNSVKPIAEGCFHGMFNYQSEYSNQNTFQRKYKQVLLFNQSSSYAVLGLYIGICNDGPKNSLQVQAKKSLGIYKARNSQVNCQSLPAQWMQIIDQNYRETLQNNIIQQSKKDIGNESKRTRIYSTNTQPKKPSKIAHPKLKSNILTSQNRTKLVL